MNVANRSCIRRLSIRALFANRTRNLVAVLAIALTAVLFTSLFTIGMSINEGFQQSNFRQVGGYSHGGFKYLTEEQFEEIKDDPLIKEWGLRRFLGMPTDVPFNKSHVEIGYSDANNAHWMYCDPVKGRLPEEGTTEAATDTRVLELLGIEPEIGAEFTIRFDVDGHQTTQTFILSGWWEYDEAIVANHILIPESRVDEILAETGVDPANPADGMTGSRNLDVMLRSGSRQIEKDLDRILGNYGYQSEDVRQEGYINSGVNWGYTGAQFSDSMDLTTVVIVAGVLLLILLTGYLIIYNVFQISVAGDIRFYGLLKTIGTTSRQIKRMIRMQALLLSLVGIPVGLLLGWLLGGVLTPVVTSHLESVVSAVSVNPWIFVGAALFALLTVFISCRRPGQMAAKVSPVEAVRYTEGKALHHAVKRNRKGVSLFSMAWANLGRNRGKTVVTVLSLSLAVLLLNLTVTLSNGLDMDKYVANFTATDFVVADAGQFQTGGELFNPDMALSEETIGDIAAQDGITAGGRVYGRTTPVEEFVTEDYYRQVHGRWYTEEQLDNKIQFTARDDAGFLADNAQLYGMEPFALDYLDVLDGDISKLSEPGGNYVAAVYVEDDYGKANPDSHWARLGDTITLRYVEKYEYHDMDTGEVYASLADIPETAKCVPHAVEYRDVEYEVAALVSVPNALSYRYYGDDEFVMNDQTFLRDTGSSAVMYYAFDTTDEANPAIEGFLSDYTENVNSQLDYESKSQYIGEFEDLRGMFNLLGGTLSLIIGLVGILNFINAILTGISSRRRELAVLQSIGMTGRQLKTMLALEGLLYTIGSLTLALTLVFVTSPVLGPGISNIFWFFTYHFTVYPILMMLPVFVALGILIPILSCRAAQKYSVVERLRQE